MISRNKSILKIMKFTASLFLIAIVLAGCLGLSSTALAATLPIHYEPWSFGVIADTQWTVPDDGFNPNTVAASIIKQIDQQFISAKVKLVVAVGDTVDMGSKVNIDTRALYAQDLYNVGIGFYPLRGNHEAAEDPNYKDSGPELRYAFPQIGTGINNNTPAAITTSIIPAADLANNPPVAKTGSTFTIGNSFSQPTDVDNANKSVSYSFRYNNATFVLLDQFDINGNYYNSTIPDQQAWIDSTLSTRPTGTQAFVFIHKNILGGNHKDNMFGSQMPKYDENGKPTYDASGNPLFENDPGDCSGFVPYGTAAQQAAQIAFMNAKQSAENKFIASMQSNKVFYVISGHDHHDYESLVTSPDGKSQVHQLITQSDSSKFYTPKTPVSTNDMPIQQDLGRVGYYIVTVDGPRVTVDYYGDITGGGDYGLNGANFAFVKIASMSYSLNGKENVVAQGSSYVMTDNTTVAATMENGFMGTSMSILAGTNNNLLTTNYGKKTVNDVLTGWIPTQFILYSDILRLSGMSRNLGSDKTDEYVLSMSYKATGLSDNTMKTGKFCLVTQGANSGWVNAVSKDFTTASKFILGPWNSSCKLGTYGVDTDTKTVWAVLNYNGQFAVGLDMNYVH